MFATVGEKPALHRRIGPMIAAALRAVSRSLGLPEARHERMPRRHRRKSYVVLTPRKGLSQ